MKKDPIVQIEHLWKKISFGNETVALLKDVSLSINKGEFVAIIGPSGSGKSTLLSSIGCLDKPTSGKYFLDGKDTGALNSDELAEIRRTKLGFIFQSFNLISELTALENVMVPHVYAENYSEEQGKELLKRVGLKDRMDHKPSELSGGQKQRVAIARALMNNPEVILADEPTGNLDSTSGESIFALLKELSNEGKTIILVTHDQEIANKAQRTITVKDGVVQQP